MTIDRARKAKTSRARYLAALRAGRLQLGDVVTRPPKALRNTDLWVVLLACPRVGRETGRLVCERAGVWPHLRLGELTVRQREAIVEQLP